MIPISPLDRAKVLKLAAALTSDKDSAVAVAVNASPLLAWLESAPDEDDLELRWQAMRHQRISTCGEPGDDNPDRFLAEAATLHAFMTAGRDGDDGGQGRREKLRRLSVLLRQEDS
jgi:hypothetical protein